MTSLVVGCHARALWPNGASSGVFKGEGGAMVRPPPPFGLTIIFLTNFALFCRLHFATEPYKIRVQSHGRLCNSIIQTSMPDQRLLVTCPCLQLRRVVTAGELQQTDCSKRCSS